MVEQLKSLSFLYTTNWLVVAGFLVGATFALLGRLGLPFPPGTSVATKRFWAVVMFVLPLMFSIVLKTVLAMSEQLQQVSPPIGTEVFIQTYVKQIVWPDTALNHWIKGSLKSMTDDFTDSFVDMPVSAAPTNIGEQYQFARSYILATNLGSLSTYFSQYSQMYVSDNTAAFINGVPVVRYFFFDRTKPIFTDTRKDSVDDFRTFTKDVIDRSVKPCETPFAEAINVTDYNDEAKKKLRDVLFTDAPFFALTQMDEHWLPVSVKATESPSTEKVNDAFASLIDVLQSDLGRNCADINTNDEDPLLPQGKSCYFLKAPDNLFATNPKMQHTVARFKARDQKRSLSSCLEAEVLWGVATDLKKQGLLQNSRFPLCS